MIVTIEGVKRVSGLDFVLKEFVKLKLLQSGQAQEHEECFSCLYSLSSIAQNFVFIHFWQWSTMDCFMVIWDIPLANATWCRAI